MGLLLNKAAGIDMTHVGYKGSTPALQDLMGGHVQLMFDGMATSLPLIKGGKIKAFAVSTPKRSPLLPDVPTFTELGYPQLEAVAWMGLWVKPDVPAARAGADPRGRAEGAGRSRRCASACRTSASSRRCRARRRAERVAEGRLRARRRGAEVDRLQAGVRGGVQPAPAVAAASPSAHGFEVVLAAGATARRPRRQELGGLGQAGAVVPAGIKAAPPMVPTPASANSSLILPR